MKLVIIIPVFNEEKSIQGVLSAIPKSINGISKIVPVVINDGSTDKTEEIVASMGIRTISHNKRRGVGVAFKCGIDIAIEENADIVVNIDGDGQFNPKDIPILIKPIMDRKVECTTASRFKDKELIPKMSIVKKYGNKMMSALISFLVNERYYDVSCGFRAYSKKVILHLNLIGKFTYTQETFLDLAFKDYSIKEIPLKIRGERKFGESKIAKNLFSYTFKALKIIILTFKDYKPLLFFTTISMLFLLVGLGLETFFFAHYFIHGSFSPHLWAGIGGGFMLGIGVLILSTGLLADLNARTMRYQQDILFLLKQNRSKK